MTVRMHDKHGLYQACVDLKIDMTGGEISDRDYKRAGEHHRREEQKRELLAEAKAEAKVKEESKP